MDLRAEAPDDLGEILCGPDPRAALDPKQRALLDYAVKLTKAPATCEEADVQHLRALGATDPEIHNLVQVAAYFNYINRVADALGVDLEPEMEGEAGSS
ncbi:MAG TPA: peroxidase [Planctomycetes bacterium]|nr:peroxidase [Planctomycetota bacterium]